MLRPAKGNMYSFVTHTWNVVKGKCPHDCSYCYMKQFKQPKLHFDEKEFKTDLGEGNFIFVGSSCDMWAWPIEIDWIKEILSHCSKYDNKYLFQSKNPERIYYIYQMGLLPGKTVVGTTIETNRHYTDMMLSPSVLTRSKFMNFLTTTEMETMVTIEPIMNFDLETLVDLIFMCHPEWVNIGADSKGHKLPEPSSEKINELINKLSKFTQVIPKKNLERIWNQWLMKG